MSETLKTLYDEMSKAVYRESSVREASFLGLTTSICGIPVRQLTPYQYMLLDFANSPFLKGGDVDDATMVNHIYKFLWLISPDFKENDASAYETFVKEKCADLDFVKAIREIADYLTDMFMDSPLYKEKIDDKQYRPSYYAWIVGYIDTLANEYGWTDEYIIHLPIPRILQYDRAITARKMAQAGKAAVLVNNISDPIITKIRAEHIKMKQSTTKKD